MLFARITKSILIAVVLLKAWQLRAQEPQNYEPDVYAKKVYVVVNVPHWTPAKDKIYITGEIPSLCRWKTPCKELEKINAYTYALQIDVPRHLEKFEFKITRGNWNNEAANLYSEPLWNQVFPLLHLEEDWNGNHKWVEKSEWVVNVPHWRDLPPLSAVTGELEIENDFGSRFLEKRRSVRVLLPRSYKSSPQTRYPVVYWQDGQNLFDPSTSHGGVDWSLDEALNQLRGQELIVVGIDNTDDRFSEYNPMEEGENYLRFLTEELKPWIDTHYRTLSSRQHTWVAGSSMGAVISVAALWKHSDIFSAALAVALPALIEDYCLEKFLQKYPGPQQSFRLWIDHGTHDWDRYYGKDTGALAKKLQSQFPKSDIEYLIYNYSGHHESDWARRAPEFLSWLINP